MSKNIGIVRKIVAIMVVTAISTLTLVPFGISAASKAQNTENSLLPDENTFQASLMHIFTEAFDKSEAEGKILTDIPNRYSPGLIRAGHLLNGYYSIPPERNYLLDEPPIA